MLDLKMDNWVLGRLAEPFPLEELRWLPQAGKIVPYLNARSIVARLNEVVGVENWTDSYSPIQITTTNIRDITDYQGLVEAGKATVENRYGKDFYTAGEAFKKFEVQNSLFSGVSCTLTILGVAKTDVGSPSYAEQLKGSYSDALKRAAVKFGVGEYLAQVGMLNGRWNAKLRRPEVLPELPDWALPDERPSPDPVVQGLIEQVQETSLTPEQTQRADVLISAVSAMGTYFPGTPLIVKRAVYEGLKELLEEVAASE